MKPVTDRAPLSAAQLEIMQVVWDAGETTVGRIWRALADRRPISRNTVGTLVQRLEDKGWLKRREEGNTFHYRAAAPRRQTFGAMLERLLDSAFGGSVEGLVLALLERRPPTLEEAARIRKRIAEAEKLAATKREAKS